MNGIWLASYIGLWLVVLFLLFAMFTLARQVGLLHSRLGPVGARMSNAGPEIGAVAPPLRAIDLNGNEVTLGSERGRPSLLVFIATGCSSCATLAPALRAIWKKERNHLDLVLLSLYSREESVRRFVEQYKLDRLPVVITKNEGTDYQVETPPYGIIVDADGVVRSKGLVNGLEHLESLLNVLDLGNESVQDWFLEQRKSQGALVTEVAPQ